MRVRKAAKHCLWILAAVGLCFFSVITGSGVLLSLAIVISLASIQQVAGRAFMVVPYGFNKNMDSAIYQIADLINRANWRVNIVSGSLRREVYDSSVIRTAIEAAIDRGVEIKILIVGDKFDARDYGEHHWMQQGEKAGKIRVQHFPKQGVPHLITVDGTHVRIEKSHKPSSPERKATCRYFGPRLANKANTMFDKLLRQAAAGNTQAATAHSEKAGT